MSDNSTGAWRLTPHLTFTDSDKAIQFYVAAFGAKEITRHMMPGSTKIMHAAVDINGSTIFLNDDFPEWNEGKRRDPEGIGGTPITLHLDVPDVDAAFARAIERGGTVTMPVEDQFWGARYGQFIDPFGYRWSLSTQTRQPSEAEIQEAAKAWAAQ